MAEAYRNIRLKSSAASAPLRVLIRVTVSTLPTATVEVAVCDEGDTVPWDPPE